MNGIRLPWNAKDLNDLIKDRQKLEFTWTHKKWMELYYKIYTNKPEVVKLK